MKTFWLKSQQTKSKRLKMMKMTIRVQDRHIEGSKALTPLDKFYQLTPLTKDLMKLNPYLEKIWLNRYGKIKEAEDDEDDD